MKTFLGALNIFLLLGLLALAFWLMGRDVGTLTLVWHGWEVTTTAAMGVLGLLILLLLAFYVGQFMGWLGRLPATVRAWFQAGPPKPELPRLVQVLALTMMGDDKNALKLLDKLHPTPSEELLEAFVRLHVGVADPVELHRWETNPILGPYVALTQAQQAALTTNWPLVVSITHKAITQFGKTLPLQLLHLKGLLQTGETTKAQAFAPTLRGVISNQHYALLDMALRGPTSTTAAALDNPWFDVFQQWLSTPSVVFPDVPSQTPQKPR